MAPGEHVHIAPHESVAYRNTLWLSVRVGRDNWLFEIGPDEERAIVVGSLVRAHVRINRDDIAPVHFHFERERDRIRVCPAYAADLCVNGTRIAGPLELEAHATIAFAGITLEAYVCDIEPNILEQLDLRDWTTEKLPDCGAVFSLPDGAEVTRAIPRLSLVPSAPTPETRKYTSLAQVWSESPNEATEPWDWPLTRLGLAARKRPAAATVAAACGAALLSLAMLATDQLVPHTARELPHADRVAAATSLGTGTTGLPWVALSSGPGFPGTEAIRGGAAPTTSQPDGLVRREKRDQSPTISTLRERVHLAAQPREKCEAPCVSRKIPVN